MQDVKNALDSPNGRYGLCADWNMLNMRKWFNDRMGKGPFVNPSGRKEVLRWMHRNRGESDQSLPPVW